MISLEILIDKVIHWLVNVSSTKIRFIPIDLIFNIINTLIVILVALFVTAAN